MIFPATSVTLTLYHGTYITYRPKSIDHLLKLMKLQTPRAIKLKAFDETKTNVRFRINITAFGTLIIIVLSSHILSGSSLVCLPSSMKCSVFRCEEIAPFIFCQDKNRRFHARICHFHVDIHIHSYNIRSDSKDGIKLMYHHRQTYHFINDNLMN